MGFRVEWFLRSGEDFPQKDLTTWDSVLRFSTTEDTTMRSGYCYEWDGSGQWTESNGEGWDIEIYTPTGAEVFQDMHTIDGSRCAVYLCPDKLYRAQVAIGSA